MSKEYIETLLEERNRLIQVLASKAWLLHGTWVERYSTCTRPDCECHTGKRHGPRHYLATMQDGKQRQTYVRRNQEALVRAGIRQSQEVDSILLQITQINLELLKEGYYDDIQP